MAPGISLRRVLSASLIALGITVLGACQTASDRVATHIADYVSPDLQSAGLREVWQRPIGLAPGETVKNAWRVGSSIYVATSEGELFRLAADSGVKQWNIAVGTSAFAVSRPVDLPKSDVTLAMSARNIMLVSRSTGRQIAAKNLTFSLTTDPVYVNDLICVGGMERFYGLFADQLGGIKWSFGINGEMFVADPAVTGQDIIIANRGGELRRISVDTGMWDWKDRKTNGPVVAPLVCDSRAVFVPCLDNHVYAFDLTTGAELWNTYTEGRLDQGPYIITGLLLVPSTGKGIYAYNTGKGDRRWFAPGVKEVGTIAAGKAWVLDDSGQIRSIDVATGETGPAAPAHSVQQMIKNAEDGLVYTVTKGGMITAFEPAK